MRILISASYYAPHISGLTNSIRNLAELLADNGYTVTVLTTQHKKNFSLQEIINNVTVLRVPYFLKISKAFVMPRFPFFVYSILQKTDQVIINLPQPEGFVVALLAKLLGKKVHSLYVCDVTLGNGFVPKVVEGLLRGANTLALLFSDTIITLTDDFKQKIPVSPTLKSEVKVILPVIVKPVIRKVTPHDDKVFRIGFIGRIASEKGIQYLLETIPILKEEFDKKFIIVFAGPTQVVGEKEYLEKIKRMMVAEKRHIEQIGELRDEELGAFYKNLDVLVLPSINSTEVFGMVQVEAMLCGTPVVASDLPGVRVPVKLTGMGEIAKIKDTRDLAEKISKVIKNKSSYVKKQAVVEQYFSKQEILSQYKVILQNTK